MPPTPRRGLRAALVRPQRDIGRGTSPRAEAVSDALRLGTDPFVRRRRAASALTLLATTALGVVEAYQTGLIRRVPEPDWPGLDADRVDATGEAYRLLSTPDAALGIVSYGATLVLLGMGTAERAREQPVVPVLAAAKVVADTVGGAVLFVEQVAGHRRLCGWCTVAAAASAATVPLVLPEARAAWRHMRSRT